jgi:FMN-dependent dehydrogenase
LTIFASRVARRIVAIMKVRDMRKLVQLRTVPLDAKTRRLGGCYDISDLRRVAKRRIPRPVFDYVDGAADEEISVAANVAAFRSWRFLPRMLAGVASADTSASVPWSPFFVTDPSIAAGCPSHAMGPLAATWSAAFGTMLDAVLVAWNASARHRHCRFPPA